MEVKVINSRICLEPKHLDSDIYNHLLEKIKNQMINFCSKQHGFILDVNKIIDVKENKISAANSDIVFTVSYEVKTLKPKVGIIFEGDICLVFNKGVFINVDNKMKILVIPDSLTKSGYQFDASLNIYKNGVRNLSKGDVIRVMCTGVMYVKQKFNCYGELVE